MSQPTAADDPDAVPGPALAGAVLVLEADLAQRKAWQRVLRRAHALVDAVPGIDEASELLRRVRYQTMVVGLPRRGHELLSWACAMRRAARVRRVVVIAPERSIDTAVLALRGGADDFLVRNCEDEELLHGARGPVATPDTAADSGSIAELLGDGAAMTALRADLERISATSGPVLLLGETGTGRETVARHLHATSARTGALVNLNCALVAPGSLEEILCGIAPRSAPRMSAVPAGALLSATGGTLFLDNLGELGAEDQARLLGLLDDRGRWPAQPRSPAARLIVADRPDLAMRCRDGRFREDLYFRVGAVTINLPPLRDRVADIPALAEHLALHAAARAGIPPPHLDGRELDLLCAHDWPGNVRELRDAIERWVLTGRSPTEWLGAGGRPPAVAGDWPLDWTLRQVEDAHIARVLTATAGNKSEAARRLGVSRKTLERRSRPTGGNDGAKGN